MRAGTARHPQGYTVRVDRHTRVTIVGTVHAVALAVLHEWYDESTVNTAAKR